MEASAAPAATCERSIAAAVARIRENVLEWEPLRWPHESAFVSIRRAAAGGAVECGRDGYRFDLRDGRRDRGASLSG